MKTAQLIKDNLPNFQGHAALYKVNPPIREEGWGEEDAVQLHHYVIASAVDSMFGVETYLFPADGDGEITSWGELEGSMKGVVSHSAVFDNIGYDVLPLSLT